MRRALIAALTLAMALQAAFGCAFAATQTAEAACCAINCGHSTMPTHQQCCKASPLPDSAEVASAASTPPPLRALGAISVARTSAQPSMSLTASSLASRAGPSSALLDQLCSLQI